MWTIRELKQSVELIEATLLESLCCEFSNCYQRGNGGFNVNWNSNRSEFESTALTGGVQVVNTLRLLLLG